jgi:hypothetical protein
MILATRKSSFKKSSNLINGLIGLCCDAVVEKDVADDVVDASTNFEPLVVVIALRTDTVLFNCTLVIDENRKQERNIVNNRLAKMIEEELHAHSYNYNNYYYQQEYILR